MVGRGEREREREEELERQVGNGRCSGDSFLSPRPPLWSQQLNLISPLMQHMRAVRNNGERL